MWGVERVGACQPAALRVREVSRDRWLCGSAAGHVELGHLRDAASRVTMESKCRVGQKCRQSGKRHQRLKGWWLELDRPLATDLGRGWGLCR